jgi:hypothetical protein
MAKDDYILTEDEENEVKKVSDEMKEKYKSKK